MNSNDLQEAAHQDRSDNRGQKNPAQGLLQSMDAVTKGMAHSNGAAGKASSETFAKCTQFGLPSLLFTVTPEDHCNLENPSYEER